ncbi:MAG: sigma-70 family RNA polymerase sigma factor [Saprospiraceae bacterium]|nr:sigma-70 family RNA polymerase sigma factor [Saprospiraceae bacterium]
MSMSKKSVSVEHMQEEWLEVQAAQRDPARFRPLYNRYYEPIFRFIFRRTNQEELTADICSQVFLKALQRINSYSYKGVPFSAWLYRIASNEVAQHYRATQKNRVVSMEESSFTDMIDELDEQDTEGLRQQLLATLDTLKEGDLQLIELRFFEQRSFREVAEITGITENNAKVRTYRILERMKKKIANSSREN